MATPSPGGAPRAGEEPPLGGISGRQVFVRRVGVDETKAQQRRRRASRLMSHRFSHDRDTIDSAQPPSPPSIPWSEWPAHIGTKIKNAFTITVDWLQQFVMGTVNLLVDFFSSPFKSSQKDKRAAEKRAVEEGRTTPQNFKKMLKKLKNPKDDDERKHLLDLIMAGLKRLDRSELPADQTLLKKIYSAVGKIVRKKEELPPAPPLPPQEEKKKETWRHWVGRPLWAVGRGARYLGGGVNSAVSGLVALSDEEEGEVYLKANGSDFVPQRVSEHAALIRDIYLKAKKPKKS